MILILIKVINQLSVESLLNVIQYTSTRVVYEWTTPPRNFELCDLFN